MSSKRAERIDVVNVVRHEGQRIEVPTNMTLPQAIEVLTREHKMQEEVVQIQESVDCFPMDGAFALQAVLEEMFGVVFATAIPSFFGSRPPSELSIEVGYKKTAKVRWGRFKIPGTDSDGSTVNFIETVAMPTREGRPGFMLGGIVQRKYEHIVRKIAERVRERVISHSLYKGKAFRMAVGSSGENPTIKFLNLANVKPEEMVFSETLHNLIAVNLWTPILEADLVAKLKIPLKRGILLAGPYGTGKTLLAYVTASYATEAGWTFIYLENVEDLPTAILWAKQFGRVVIFAEDLDKADTTDDNTLPNTLDGLDTKDSEVMVVLTTNHLDKVNQLLLRPGRLDCILPVDPPDAAAQVKLLEVYGKGLIKTGEDLTAVGKMLADRQVIPAVTREVVERAKLSFVHRAPFEASSGRVSLTADDLLYSVQTMEAQARLLAPKAALVPTPVEQFGEAMGKHVAKGIAKLSGKVAASAASEAAEAVRDMM